MNVTKPSNARRAAAAALLLWVLLPAAALQGADPVLVKFEDYPPDKLLAVNNGSLETRRVDGRTIYRWRINTGQTSTLRLRADHPLYGRLRYYDHLRFDFRIASGLIHSMGLHAMGHVSGPRRYKVHMWTSALRTTKPGVWLGSYCDLSRPDRLLTENPDGAPAGGYFALRAMSIEPDTVIELKNIRLSRGMVILKPDYMLPITWPIRTDHADGGASYRISFRVLNVSARPAVIRPEVLSKHRRFRVAFEPKAAKVGFGRIADFTLTATISAADIAASPELYAETLRVRFAAVHAPDGAVYWRGRLVRPLSKTVRRQVILSPEQLRKIRRGVQGGDEKLKAMFAYDRTLAAADAFVTKRLDLIPHSYSHVRNGYPGAPGGRGRMMPGSFMPEALDPGGKYREVGTNRAGVVWYNYLGYAGQACRKLGMAYLMSRDEKYARKAIELLELYAEQFTQKPWTYWRDVPWNLGPTVGASSRIADFATYGSNWYMKGHCRLASMIADSPSWSPEARDRVYRRFIVPYITELTKIAGTIGNQQDITNHNLLLLGLAFRDATCVHRALLSDSGAVSRLYDIEPDGFSSEGRPLNYHFAAMNEYLPTIVFLQNSALGIDYPKDRILAALRMPYQRATLGGVIAGAGDSGRGHGMEYYGARNARADWLISIFPDEQWLYDIGGAGTAAKKLWLLKADRKSDPQAWRKLLETTPRLFAHSGMAVLRSGRTEDEQVMVTLDYGRNVYHAAMDRNHIAIAAFSKRFTQGTGSSYNVGSGGIWKNRDPRLRSFNGSGSLGQNVVMIDALGQIPAVGRLLAWSDDADYQLAVARVDGIRPGVSHTRGVVLSRGIIVLLDRLASDARHTYDHVYHNFGELKLPDGWKARPLDKPLATTANYQNIVDPARLDGSGTIRLKWDLTRQYPRWDKQLKVDESKLPTVAMELWRLPVAGGEAFIGTTAANNKDTNIMPDAMPSLIHRVRAANVDYVTVLEPHKGTSRVAAVKAGRNGGVVVTLTDGRTIEADLEDLVKRFPAKAPGK